MVNLSQYDRIVLTQEDVDGIWDWCRHNTDYKMRDLPITEGVFEFQNGVLVGKDKYTSLFMYFHTEETGTFMQTLPSGEPDTGFHWLVYPEMKQNKEGDRFLNFQLAMPMESKLQVTEEVMDHITHLCGIWLSCMCFMREYRDVSERVSVSSHRYSKEKKPRGGKGKKRVVKLTSKIYRLSVPSVSEQPKRTIERHTEAWGVRGHNRHYKSGKVVFVKEHTRGIGHRQPKEYHF